jgi:hypothetical protein
VVVVTSSAPIRRSTLAMVAVEPPAVATADTSYWLLSAVLSA